MTIQINDDNIQLHFGMKFIKSLDERIAKILDQNINDEAFGQGLVTYIQLFLGGDYESLAIVLYDATCTMETGRPSMDDIYDYIDSCEDPDKLANEVLEELKKSGVCRRRATQGEETYLQSQNPNPEKAPRRNTKK